MATASSDGIVGRGFVCAGAEMVPVDLVASYCAELGLVRKSWEKLRTRLAAVLVKALQLGLRYLGCRLANLCPA